MSLTINETFRVDASADRAFAFLTNPAEVVTCLPGAELLETIDARTYAGRVKVKVGPITTAYAGRATLDEVDAAARRVVIVGEGKESGGAGSARMTLNARVTSLADGASEVNVDASIDIAGRVMQFGRGLIESVNRQLFKQFVEAMQAKLAGPHGADVDTTASNAASGQDARASGTPPAAPMQPPGHATPDTPVLPSPPRATAPPISPLPPPLPRAVAPQAGAAVRPVVAGSELRVLPLLWRSLLDWLRSLFRRR